MPVAIGAAIGISNVFIAGVVGSAIIGAAIGGITAAVTGGSIGKGMLFGAVGGAVMGGITGALGGFSGTAATSVSMNENVVGAAANSGGLTSATNATTSAIGGASKAFSVGKMFSGLAGEGQAALIGTVGSTLMGAFDDTAEKQMKLEEQKLKQQNEQFYANLEAQKEIAGMSGGGGGGSDAIGVAKINQETAMKQLAEQRRQFDTGTTLDAQRLARQQAAASGLTQAKAGGYIEVPSGTTQVAQETATLAGGVLAPPKEQVV